MSRQLFSCARSSFLLALAIVVSCLSLEARAQQTSPDGDAPVPVLQLDPAEMGIILGDGTVSPADGRRVLVKGSDGTPIVANVHLEVGERFVVLLPDGRLTSVPTVEATLTERPFQPHTKEQLTKQLTEKFPGFKIRSTKRFLYVSNSSEAFYQGTSRILETMYPNLFAYCKRQKIDVRDPATPLVVIMFRTRKQWQEFSAALFKDKDTSVVAYYSGVTNWVVMYEQSDLAEMAPELALKQSISTIAHEGTHQILHNIGVQQRLSRWPMWISEGLPEYFSPTSFDKGVRWKGVGLVNDLRMKSLDTHLRKNSASSAPGELVKSTVNAQTLESLGYACAWGLSHFLAERRKEKFFAYLADVSKIGPLEKASVSSKGEDLFIKHFGNDFAGLEREMIAHLQRLPYVDPIENMTHYVCMLSKRIGLSVQRSYTVTVSPASVKQWQAQELGTLSAAAQAGSAFAIEIFPTKTSAMNFAANWLRSP